MIKKCSKCGEEFNSISSQKYCNKCRTKKCIICGNEFIRKGNRGQGDTCSEKCKREKIKRTNLEKYGGHPNSNKKVQEKRRQTCLDKYGTTHPVQSKEVQEKIKKTCLKRYGVNYYTQTEEIKEKFTKNYIGKYGKNYSNPGQVPEVKRKIRLKRYKNPNYNNREKMKETCLKRYGVENPSQIPEVRRKIEKTFTKHYGVPFSCIVNSKNRHGAMSSINKYFMKKLIYNNINVKLEYPLQNFVYDFYLPDYNLLIEINPTYTHNITKPNIYNRTINKDYHLIKTKKAIKNNYQILNIFDWDSQDIIIENIKQKKFPTYKLINRKNFFNIKTHDRIIDLEEKLDEQDLINKGYVVIYDVI